MITITITITIMITIMIMIMIYIAHKSLQGVKVLIWIVYVIHFSAHVKVIQAKFVCPNFRPGDLLR